MTTTSCARVLLALGVVALGAGCGNPRSLLKVYVDGDQQFADVTLSLQAVGSAQETVASGRYPSVTVPLAGVDTLRVGLYLPASARGAMVIRGSVLAGACEIGVGQATAANIDSGAVVTVNLTVKSQPCVSTADGGTGGSEGDAGEDVPGSGGASGSGGMPGSGGSAAGGSGGQGGSGGGSGGQGGSGDGSGGTIGSGGMPGSGGAGTGGVPVDVPPEVGPDACDPETVARTCGRRCNIDVINNCGQTVHCGGCATVGDMCGDLLQPNVCVPCQDDGRACRNIQCGVVTDACGRRVNCGICGLRQECCNGRCELPIRCQML
ncbi:MAG: hypothetical protein QOI66_1232 [Myxococcales bacterium]|nr:hypothetical protein [Myxococcales bacterium]